jgi:hypothetical protein
MRYLSTKLGTGFDGERHPTVAERALNRLNPNPDYDLSLVHEWFLEFDDDDAPFRELGLDSSGAPVLAGPNDGNYGFWLDTNMRYSDFDGTAISAHQFELKWKAWAKNDGMINGPSEADN